MPLSFLEHGERGSKGVIKLGAAASPNRQANEWLVSKIQPGGGSGLPWGSRFTFTKIWGQSIHQKQKEREDLTNLYFANPWTDYQVVEAKTVWLGKSLISYLSCRVPMRLFWRPDGHRHSFNFLIAGSFCLGGPVLRTFRLSLDSSWMGWAYFSLEHHSPADLSQRLSPVLWSYLII